VLQTDSAPNIKNMSQRVRISENRPQHEKM